MNDAGFGVAGAKPDVPHRARAAHRLRPRGGDSGARGSESRPILDIAVEETGLPREELARILDPRASPVEKNLPRERRGPARSASPAGCGTSAPNCGNRLAGEPATGGAPRIGHYAGVDPRRLESLIPAAATRAAVLIPVIDRGDDLTVLLTLRADDLKHHAGQISFPGGRVEAGDADAVATALRETEEEIGLRREFVEVLGRLPDHAVITGYRVTADRRARAPGL